MTTQELFETAVRGLFKQGRRCADDTGCYYRGENAKEPETTESLKGLKCGVGMVISDEDYKPYMEGFSVDQVAEGIVSGSELTYLRQNSLILSAVQECHDNYKNWESEYTLKAAFLRITQMFTSLDGSFIANLKLGE